MNLNITTELSNEAQNPLLRVGAVMPSCLSHGSLFSGIGGFDLAAQWMGWNNIFQCEKDEWCRKVLTKNFPNTKRFEDIKQFNAKEYNGTIDVISGGFPCQPFSVAGQRKGKDDDRYLWEEMLRVIGEVQPKFVVGENVTGIIGMALDTVLSDLEAQNYTTETYIIPACSKNAWHRRDRVWIVAYSNSIRWNNEQKDNGQTLHNENGNGATKEQSRGKQQRRTGKPGSILSNSESKLSNERENGNDTEQREIQLQTGGSNSIFTNSNDTRCKEQRQPITDGTELFAPKCSSWWETEPELGRVVDGLSGRVDRLKGLGNAIVPQVAYEIFRSIGELHWHGA
jgi:DNA (cytosine-5)-methyltransferase 1